MKKLSLIKKTYDLTSDEKISKKTKSP